MALGLDPRGSFKADINITPLVDVVLVLLIIFMVVTPLLGRGRDLDLPRAHGAASRQQANDPGLVLSITSDGEVWFEAKKVSSLQLAELASARKARARYLNVLVRADSRVSVRNLRPLLRTLKQVGVSQISFAVLGTEGSR